VRWR